MDAVMVQDDNKWNCNLFKDFCDESNLKVKVPPPSPQDASMLEAVFSKHLSVKIHAVMNSSQDTDSHQSQHARTLEKLLLNRKPTNCMRRLYHKRPSRIPVLSSRLIQKKKNNRTQQDSLANAFERIHISNHQTKEKNKSYLNGIANTVMKNSKKNDTNIKETINGMDI
jgi:hypothetical protein